MCVVRSRAQSTQLLCSFSESSSNVGMKRLLLIGSYELLYHYCDTVDVDILSAPEAARGNTELSAVICDEFSSFGRIFQVKLCVCRNEESSDVKNFKSPQQF